MKQRVYLTAAALALLAVFIVPLQSAIGGAGAGDKTPASVDGSAVSTSNLLLREPCTAPPNVTVSFYVYPKERFALLAMGPNGTKVVASGSVPATDPASGTDRGIIVCPGGDPKAPTTGPTSGTDRGMIVCPPGELTIWPTAGDPVTAEIPGSTRGGGCEKLDPAVAPGGTQGTTDPVGSAGSRDGTIVDPWGGYPTTPGGTQGTTDPVGSAGGGGTIVDPWGGYSTTPGGTHSTGEPVSPRLIVLPPVPYEPEVQFVLVTTAPGGATVTRTVR